MKYFILKYFLVLPIEIVLSGISDTYKTIEASCW